MRKILAAIILAVVIFSCDDNDTTSSDNFISAQKNNVTWNGRTEMMFDLNNNADTLIILGIGTEETLVMMIKFTGTGYYPIQKYQGSYYTTLGGDVLTSEYKTDDGNYSGAVRITRYDEADKTVEGNFNVNLKQMRSNPQNGIDAVSFTKGQFRGKIKN